MSSHFSLKVSMLTSVAALPWPLASVVPVQGIRYIRVSACVFAVVTVLPTGCGCGYALLAVELL